MKPGMSWSPYYKVQAFTPAGEPTSLAINVNGVPHQTAEEVKERDAKYPLYGEPYKVGQPSPANALIIGARSGNDVA